MTYHVTHRWGATEASFPSSRFPELLDELEGEDPEHPCVSVVHESEWALSVYAGGRVALENLEEGEPRHLTALGHDDVLALMRLVAEGRIGEVDGYKWRPGYP